MSTTTLPTIKPTSALPSIIAVTGRRDSGEYGNASCPHCGALGRYVWTFICSDGTRRGAMSGCIKLFPQMKDTSRIAKLIQEAFDRRAKAEEERKNLASWWREMVEAAEEFGSAKLPDHDAIKAAIQVLYAKVSAAESRRQEWLNRNGYGRGGRRW